MYWLFWDVENTGNDKVLLYWDKPHDKTNLIICCSNKVTIPQSVFARKNPFNQVELVIFNKREKDKADNLLVQNLQNHLTNNDIKQDDTIFILSNDRLLNQRFQQEADCFNKTIDLAHTSKMWEQLLYDIFIFKSGKTIESCFCKRSEFVSKKSLETTFKTSASKVIRELTKHKMLIPISKRRWKINVKNNPKALRFMKKAA